MNRGTLRANWPSGCDVFAPAPPSQRRGARRAARSNALFLNASRLTSLLFGRHYNCGIGNVDIANATAWASDRGAPRGITQDDLTKERHGASRWQGREASDGAEDVRFGLP